MRRKLKNLLNLDFEKYITFFVVATISLFSLLRFYKINNLPLWFDEIISANYSEASILVLLQMIMSQGINMSLFSLLLNLWHQAFPFVDPEWLRVFSAVFSVFGIIAVYYLGKTIIGDEKKGKAVGLLMSLFVSVNVFHFVYAQELRSYSLVFLLTVLSTIALIKVIENKNSTHMWILYSAITALSLYAHIFAVFVFLSHLFAIFLLPNSIKNKLKNKIIPSFLVAFGLILPLVFFSLIQQGNYITWIASPTIHSVTEIFIRITGGNIYLSFLYLVFVFLGSIFVFKFNPKNSIEYWKLKLTTICFIAPIVLSLVISLFKPMFLDRYLIVVIPYFTFLAVYGIVSLEKQTNLDSRLVRIIVVVVIAFFVFISVAGIGNYFKNYKKENFQKASIILAEKCKDHSKYYYPYFIDNAFIYFNKNLASGNRSWYEKVNGEDGPEEKLLINGLTQENVCLIVSEYQSAVIAKKSDGIGSVVLELKEKLDASFEKQEMLRVDLFTLYVYSGN